MATLSNNEIETYREEGLVIPKFRLTGDLFAGASRGLRTDHSRES